MRDDKEPDFKSGVTDYAKYAGIVVKMGVIILLGGLIGDYFDRTYNMGIYPIFTVSISLFSIGLALYLSIKDLIK